MRALLVTYLETKEETAAAGDDENEDGDAELPEHVLQETGRRWP
jgi:hypothetical protein